MSARTLRYRAAGSFGIPVAGGEGDGDENLLQTLVGVPRQQEPGQPTSAPTPSWVNSCPGARTCRLPRRRDGAGDTHRQLNRAKDEAHGAPLEPPC